MAAAACAPLLAVPLAATSSAPAARNVTQAEQLFVQAGCAGCHTMAGVPGATGIAGPNLTNVSLRPTLAGESIPNTPETLAAFLLDPAALRPDARMPNVGLAPQEAAELAAFLFALPNR